MAAFSPWAIIWNPSAQSTSRMLGTWARISWQQADPGSRVDPALAAGAPLADAQFHTRRRRRGEDLARGRRRGAGLVGDQPVALRRSAIRSLIAPAPEHAHVGQQRTVRRAEQRDDSRSLAICGAPSSSADALDQMRHGAADAAMAVAEQAAMGVQRLAGSPLESARRTRASRLAATGEAEVFQQHRERGGRAAVDRGVPHVGDGKAGGLPCARR